jgi:hypothetical protein
MRRAPALPALRRKRSNSISYAHVLLTDAVTKQRRDIPLGRWDDPKANEACLRVVAQWQARGRRLDLGAVKVTPSQLAVSRLCDA